MGELIFSTLGHFESLETLFERVVFKLDHFLLLCYALLGHGIHPHAERFTWAFRGEVVAQCISWVLRKLHQSLHPLLVLMPTLRVAISRRRQVLASLRILFFAFLDFPNESTAWERGNDIWRFGHEFCFAIMLVLLAFLELLLGGGLAYPLQHECLS